MGTRESTLRCGVCMRRYRVWLGLGLTAALVAVGAVTVMGLFAVVPPAWFSVIDQGGANDQPGQKDLTRLGRNDQDPDYYNLYWSWDETDFHGQRGDACALFDSDGDG